MPIFQDNQRISLRKTPSNKGRISSVLSQHKGQQFYEVTLDNGHVKTVAEHDLIPEQTIHSAWDLLANNIAKDYLDFSIASTVSKIRNKTNNTISTLKASRTLFLPYQFIPLLKFLRSDSKRILIADEVGLGKTIEAGHILLELAARNNLRNALVICTNALKDKWKTELQEKFNFGFKIYESTRELIRDIEDESNTSVKNILGIVNYEKCRNENLIEIIEETGYGFDLVICDEAHSIRNSSTQQHKGVSKIIDHSEAVVLLTATPIMTEIQNLQNLLKVLDKEAFGTDDIFFNAVEANKPFVLALSRLRRNEDLKTIAEDLHHSTIVQSVSIDDVAIYTQQIEVSEIFKTDELYQRARKKMLTGDDSHQNRVSIQNDLIDLNSLNHIYSRTRKKDVRTENLVTRMPKTLLVHLSEPEKNIYNDVIELYEEENPLALMTKKRQVSSSIPAYKSSKADLGNGKYFQRVPDTKFELLKDIIHEVVIQKQKKLIVFAFFTKSLLYLKARLDELSIGNTIIYGAIKDRTERIQKFKDDPNLKILLSSEVGSEGLDLQFCDALVNYDLPWNPMKVEQRIGRIDRVGQKSEIINIYNLVIKGTIEERIHRRLFDRIKLFEQTIGDLEEILGEKEDFLSDVEKSIQQLYNTKLTVDQQNRILDNIGLAIEQKKLDLRLLQKELKDSFANDTHFKSEVENLEKNARYITETDLVQYIKSIIRTKLHTLRIKKIDDDLYLLEIPANSQDDLFDFIKEFKDKEYLNPELDKLYRRFKRFYGEQKIKFTFNQKYAFDHKDVEYISAFHPLVNAITNYFERQKLDINQAHQFSIPNSSLDSPLSEGFYLMAIFGLTTERDFGRGDVKKSEITKTIVCDLNQEPPAFLNEQTGNKLFAACQSHAEYFKSEISLNHELIKALRSIISMKIIEIESEVKEDEEIKFYSSIDRRTNQEIAYLTQRIERLDTQLREGKGIAAILKSNRNDFLKRLEQSRHQKENATIEVGHHLIALNFIHIYETDSHRT